MISLAPAMGALAAPPRQEVQPLSPARGHAQVVAQGVAPLPAGDAVWRVTYQTMPPVADATTEARDLGFVVADQGTLRLRDEPDGRRMLLSPGEAAFSAPAVEQRRASAGADPASAYVIDLVLADEADPSGEGIPVFASPAFAAPAGDHEVSLVRDVLGPDETTTISGDDAPVLVLATLGTVRVEGDDGAAASLLVGEAEVFSGELTIRGEGPADAAFVAAVIGQEVPADGADDAPAVATPAAGSGPGRIAVVIHACPPEVQPGEFNPTACPRDPVAADLTIARLGAGDDVRGMDETEVEFGIPVWVDLPLGEYLLRADSLAENFDRFFVPGLDSVGGPAGDGFAAGADGGYQVNLTENASSFRLDVYAFGSDEAGDDDADATATPRTIGSPVAGSPTPENGTTSSITIELFVCGAGETIGTFDPAACTPAPGPFDLILASEELAAPRTLGDADDEGGAFVWDDLPFGVYTYTEPLLPPGVATFYIADPAATLLADNSGYALTLDAENPNLTLDVYNFPPPPPPPTLPPPPPTAIPAAPTETPVPVPAATSTPVPVATEAVAVDSDSDGLTDDVETGTYGTDPATFDTDGDGIGDGDEIANGTDPFTPPAPTPVPAATLPPADADSDGDGLTDPVETALGTDPFNDDSDRDGWIDGNEVNLGTDPLDPASFPTAP